MVKRKPRGYWQEWSNIERELNEIINEFGEIPGEKKLKEIGKGQLFYAICRCYGGIPAVREKMGQESSRKPRGYWNLDNTLKECRTIVEIHGDLPSQRELNKMGLSRLAIAIVRNGGAFKIRKTLGLERKISPKDYWTEERIESEVQSLVEELGYLPDHERLSNMGRGDLASAIKRHYEGSFPNLRNKLDLNPERLTEEKVLDGCREMVEREGSLPSIDKLKQMGYSPLAEQIKKFGGRPHFMKLLNLRRDRRRLGFWKDEQNRINEARKIIEENGFDKFPSWGWLNKKGYSSFCTAIRMYDGGFTEFRKKLGETDLHPKGKRGAWKDWDYFEEKMREFIDELGHFPTHEEVAKQRSCLQRPIHKYHGGMARIREKMGYGTSTITTKDHFIEFVGDNESAQRLLAIRNLMPEYSGDIETMFYEIYSERFGGESKLHEILKSSNREMEKLLENGITNLGTYLGEYSLGDRSIVPVLLPGIVDSIVDNGNYQKIESHVVKILRGFYSPRFNENPNATLSELQSRIDSSSGKSRQLFSALHRHYTDTLNLEETLCQN